jgi:hypothetical protein
MPSPFSKGVKKMKCKKDCLAYFESDGFEICNLADKPITYECVGWNEIVPKKEDLICKIGKLLKEYDELIEIENKMIGDTL